MRTLMLARAMLALVAVDAAPAAQRVGGAGAEYGIPGSDAPPAESRRHGRWGSTVDGHWWAGTNAPGGWNGYRRPYRGYALPPYWNAPRFYISDWAGYGLAPPPRGYNWARYYDDAVLIDARGSVRDTVSGIDWDGADRSRDDGEVYAGGQGGHGADYGRPDDRRPADRGYDGRRGDGVGGAAAGYAIERSAHGGRRPPRPPVAPDYGAHYPPPPGDGYAVRGHDYPPPPLPVARPAWVSPDGTTTITTTSGGYDRGGTTTVVVQNPPVVTTTTTTTTYENVVTHRPVHRVVRKVRHARPRRCR